MPQDYPVAAVPPQVCRAAAESGGQPLDKRSIGMSDFWHKMGCCVVAKPPPDYPVAAVPPQVCRAAAESGGQPLDKRSIGMSDFWHKMGCCVVAKPPPKKKRRKIDRSMIGEPTNFIHLTHIGSGEMAEGLQPSGSVQEQMRSKGPNMNGRNSLL